MLFAIDIGNTQIVAGIFNGPKIARQWRMATHRDWTADEMAALLRGFFDQDKIARSKIKAVIVSSVVPTLIPVFDTVCRRLFKLKAMVVDHTLNFGLSIKTDVPAELGADRLVNAAQAYEQVGKGLLVLDMGTAITVDAVSSKGEYLGGAIAPGVNISADALFTKAAKLPRVDLKEAPDPIGTNTGDSIRSGIYYGTVGQVREMLSRCASVMKPKPVILATGGWSGWMPLKKLGVSLVDPDLTLRGLRLVHQLNRGRAGRGAR